MKNIYLVSYVFSFLLLFCFTVTTYASGETYSYLYDKNNRLIGITQSGEKIVEFIYDKKGNLLEKKILQLDGKITFRTDLLTHNLFIGSWEKVPGATKYHVEFLGSRNTVNTNQIELKNLNPNTEYTLKVMAENSIKSSDKWETYKFKTSSNLLEIYEVNNTELQAYPLSPGTYISYISKISDLDFYEIKPKYANSNLSVKLNNTGNMNFSLKIYSVLNGKVTVLSEVSALQSNFFQYNVKAKYYVKVSALNKFSELYPYILEIKEIINNGGEICEFLCTGPVRPPSEISYLPSSHLSMLSFRKSFFY